MGNMDPHILFDDKQLITIQKTKFINPIIDLKTIDFEHMELDELPSERLACLLRALKKSLTTKLENDSLQKQYVERIQNIIKNRKSEYFCEKYFRE